LLIAEATLRAEIPRPTLTELLELTALIALKQPERSSRVSARWLLKYLQLMDDATIHNAAYAAANLQALGSRQHMRALEALRDMADEATSRTRTRGVA